MNQIVRVRRRRLKRANSHGRIIRIIGNAMRIAGLVLRIAAAPLDAAV